MSIQTILSEERSLRDAHHLGLIGGLGTAAGIFYYEEIAATDIGRPLKLSLIHADLHRVLRFVETENWIEMADYLVSLLDLLTLGGATVAAITAVTPHVVFDRVALSCRIPLVSVLDVISKTLAASSLERVALFGTRKTVESRIFGVLPTASVVNLGRDEYEAVYRIYRDVASGNMRETYCVELTKIAEKALDLGAEAIVLAGTDLSALFRKSRPAFPVLDVTRAHIDAITAYLGSPL